MRENPEEISQGSETALGGKAEGLIQLRKKEDRERTISHYSNAFAVL